MFVSTDNYNIYSYIKTVIKTLLMCGRAYMNELMAYQPHIKHFTELIYSTHMLYFCYQQGSAQRHTCTEHKHTTVTISVGLMIASIYIYINIKVNVDNFCIGEL